MTIKDMMDQFQIQGAYCIKTWNDVFQDCMTLASGTDFECESHRIKDEFLDADIKYMYCVDGVLNIEIEMEE